MEQADICVEQIRRGSAAFDALHTGGEFIVEPAPGRGAAAFEKGRSVPGLQAGERERLTFTLVENALYRLKLLAPLTS